MVKLISKAMAEVQDILDEQFAKIKGQNYSYLSITVPCVDRQATAEYLQLKGYDILDSHRHYWGGNIDLTLIRRDLNG